MKLAPSLRATTLGDLLGTLHRARQSGALDFVDDRQRVHSVHVVAGLVVAAIVDGAATLSDMLRQARLIDETLLRRATLRALGSHRLMGEVLAEDFHVSRAVVGAALRSQISARLCFLDQLADAGLRYREAVPPPRSALTGSPLVPREFLHGRRRARDPAHAPTPKPVRGVRAQSQDDALQVLGLPARACVDARVVKRAYRNLARQTHPDLHPAASAEERRRLAMRFVALTAAYRALLG